MAELIGSARWLLKTDLIILNHGQVTKTIPELAFSTYLNFHTTSMEIHLSLDILIINLHFQHGGFSSWLELVARQPRDRYLGHKTTTAIYLMPLTVQRVNGLIQVEYVEVQSPPVVVMSKLGGSRNLLSITFSKVKYHEICV
ncbi:hypothetical protein TNCV_1759331 [Trichonephila clavipes]|nr:hypothetical protein TNCV_1759331 [Trichonephila clavipes]